MIIEKSKNDRLFVPLSSEPYSWFQSGLKKWELRKYGRQYTEKHVYLGRRVELRRGYSDKTKVLWGVIEVVECANNLELFFGKVAFHEVIPVASNLQDAISQVALILRIHPNENLKLIGFKMKIVDIA